MINRNVALIATAALGALLLVTVPASANNKVGGGDRSPAPSGSGDAEGQDISASAKSSGQGVQYDKANNGKGASVGPLVPEGNWSPPACWYAPKWTAAEFKADQEHTWSLESTGYEWDAAQRDRYEKGNPYTNFNLDKEGKGYWWTSYANEDGFPPGWDSCTKPSFWVDTGAAPPADYPQAVTPEILAHLAYAQIRVPDTKVNLAPANDTKVNLPTWAWLDKTNFKPVSVTAYVPGVRATTTAKPISMKLEPGTADAELYPSSGECTFGADGSIGTPYAKGDADKTPPCGLTYLRASGDNGPYQLKATITWKISWTGTGGAGGDLPDGTFGTTQDVTVQEIQAINR
ncbi:hypothetical protein [Streptomyces sp. NBC_01500]|uniref:hypothetical protein n=1 Tax=Streptomyces sp. NBC_01500 TaxID=2903886 RepID=UPI002252FB7E|nr:hypothetical protein [Streptomyces sp. NBC_01500]MCX4549011.1 hypothetical protein [Streptomyces sp. NBC_01500]